MTASVRVTPWPEDTIPTRDELWKNMVAERLSPYSWSNGPHDVYHAHSHGYDKVIYVVSGSITFSLPEIDRKITLKQGDRLDLPKGVVHDALVGPNGVVCLEGHKTG
jgi:quercetin dioxygenase-like cupin family protein